MIEKLIQKYIEKLKPQDIIIFARQNGVILSDNECQYLYDTIKNKWKNVVFGDYQAILQDAKAKLSPNAYQKVEELFFLYHKKYQSYL